MSVPAGLSRASGAGALTATQRLDLRALVVVTGNPGCDYTVDALETAMTQEGVPYTEIDLGDPGRPIVTGRFLSTTSPSGVKEGHFNAVFMTNDNPFASFCLASADPTAADEMTTLANYETTFGVRQVDSFTFPGASVGLTNGFEGSLDAIPATVTAAGLAGPFSYLNGPVPIDNYDPSVSESYGYLATPAPALGQTFTTLVDAPIPGGGAARIAGRRLQRRQPRAARPDIHREREPDLLPCVDARHHHLGDQRRSPGLQPQLFLGRRRRPLRCHQPVEDRGQLHTGRGLPHWLDVHDARHPDERLRRYGRGPTGKPRTTSDSRSPTTARRATASPGRSPANPRTARGSSTTR